MRTGSLKFGTFKLNNGALSPYYLDLHLLSSDPTIFRRLIAFYSRIIEPKILKRTDRISGVAASGVPYAVVLGFGLGKPFLSVKKEQKGGRRIEGVLLPGDRVLILDDVATTGMSILTAAQAIRAEGGVVNDAVILLDREQGASRTLKRFGVRLHSFSTVRRVARTLLAKGAIDDGEYDEIVRQIAN